MTLSLPQKTWELRTTLVRCKRNGCYCERLKQDLLPFPVHKYPEGTAGHQRECPRGLEVGVSKLQLLADTGAEGVIATRKIKAGKVLGVYDGQIMTRKEFDASDFGSMYAFDINARLNRQELVVDSRDLFGNFTRFFNHAGQKYCQVDVLEHLTESGYYMKVFRLNRDVFRGEELYISYGTVYNLQLHKYSYGLPDAEKYADCPEFCPMCKTLPFVENYRLLIERRKTVNDLYAPFLDEKYLPEGLEQPEPGWWTLRGRVFKGTEGRLTKRKYRERRHNSPPPRNIRPWSKTKRAGLKFPVDRVQEDLRQVKDPRGRKRRAETTATVYLAAVIEDLTGQVFDAAIEASKRRRRHHRYSSPDRIDGRDIMEVLKPAPTNTPATRRQAANREQLLGSGPIEKARLEGLRVLGKSLDI